MELPKKINNKSFDDAEKEFIRQNYQSMTDAEIAQKLDRKANGIYRMRKIMHLPKKNGRPRNDSRKKLNPDQFDISIDDNSPLRNLTELERKKLASKIFKSSNDYKRFCKQFTEDEMKTFTERFSDYLASWEKILPQEKEQLYTVMKEVIIQDRLLIKVKASEQIRSILSDLEIKRLKIISKDIKSEEDKKEEAQLSTTIENMKMNLEPVEHMLQDYHKSDERFKMALKLLNLTREQRLKKGEDQGMTLVSVAQGLNDPNVRKQAGEEAIIIKMQSEAFKKKVRQEGIMYGDF